MTNTFLEAMQFRHACKKFDPTRKIEEADFTTILECGRLSPTSFGMEHARFLVIQNPALREQVKTASWNQAQITECSHLIALMAQKECVNGKTDYVHKLFSRRGLDAQSTAAYLERYNGFIANNAGDDKSLACWSIKQCYIVAANMLTGAAFIGIDSCPIEGFEKDKIQEILKIDTDKEEVALLLCFGYRLHAQPKKHRLELSELITYR